MKDLKEIKELVNGKCKVVMETPFGKVIQAEGSYNEKLNIVFALMPVENCVIGYIQ